MTEIQDWKTILSGMSDEEAAKRILELLRGYPIKSKYAAEDQRKLANAIRARVQMSTE